MKNPKRSLRSILDELTSEFVDGVMAAARAALSERDAALTGFAERPARSKAASRAPSSRARVARSSSPAASTARREWRREVAANLASARREGTSDLLITDPQALLTALETAAPEVQSFCDSPPAHEIPPERSASRWLEPASEVREAIVQMVAAPSRPSRPALREGEEILRATNGSVVLRRRRA